MDVKQAVRLAKASVQDFFGDQVLSDPVLEELEYDEAGRAWNITLGFFRIADAPRSPAAQVLAQIGGARRAFKVFKVSEATGSVISVKDRELI